MPRKSPKPSKPTLYQTRVLAMIARSFLMKTRLPGRRDPIWIIDGIGEISNECAMALIRKGFVNPQRDGLPMFDETQTYVAIKPGL